MSCSNDCPVEILCEGVPWHFKVTFDNGDSYLFRSRREVVNYVNWRAGVSDEPCFTNSTLDTVLDIQGEPKSANTRRLLRLLHLKSIEKMF